MLHVADVYESCKKNPIKEEELFHDNGVNMIACYNKS